MSHTSASETLPTAPATPVAPVREFGACLLLDEIGRGEMANVAQSPIVFGTFLMVAAASFWFPERLVWLVAAIRGASYAMLVAASLWRRPHALFGAALLTPAGMPAHHVRRERVLGGSAETRDNLAPRS